MYAFIMKKVYCKDCRISYQPSGPLYFHVLDLWLETEKPWPGHQYRETLNNFRIAASEVGRGVFYLVF